MLLSWAVCADAAAAVKTTTAAATIETAFMGHSSCMRATRDATVSKLHCLAADCSVPCCAAVDRDRCHAENGGSQCGEIVLLRLADALSHVRPHRLAGFRNRLRHVGHGRVDRLG